MNEDLNDIAKIIKSLEDSGVLIDGVKETRRQILGALLAHLAALLVQPVISSIVEGISGRGVRRAGREYVNKNF